MKKNNDNLLSLEIRRKTYDLILNTPGLHLREISRRLKIPKTSLVYHLRYLEKNKLIIANSENRYKRYYVLDENGQKEKEILGLLRQEVPRHILIYLLFCGWASKMELSKELEKYPSTIEFHLKKLKKVGLIRIDPIYKGKIIQKKYVTNHNNERKEIIKNYIINRSRISNEIFYTLKEEAELDVYNMLILCKKSFFDQETINFLIKNSKKRIVEKKPYPHKIVPGQKEIIDACIERYYDIFPNPYHV
jgi:DNA-binding transcriptional ArsR family regulator